MFQERKCVSKEVYVRVREKEMEQERLNECGHV